MNYWDEVCDRLIELNQERPKEEPLTFFVNNHIESITSQLRFAADLDTLKIRRIEGPEYTNDPWIVIHMLENRILSATGKTMIEAVHKAAEQLKTIKSGRQNGRQIDDIL